MGDSNPLRCRALQSCIEHLGGPITCSLASLTRSILLVLIYQHIFLKRKGGGGGGKGGKHSLPSGFPKSGWVFSHKWLVWWEVPHFQPHTHTTHPPKSLWHALFMYLEYVGDTWDWWMRKGRKKKVWRCGWRYAQNTFYTGMKIALCNPVLCTMSIHQ